MNALRSRRGDASCVHRQVAVGAFASAGAARADADPASDVLYMHELFVPYQATISPTVLAGLLAAIRRSVAAGKPIKVALIASARDLGGIPALFGKPTEYARFLDAELQFVYSGRVLVVMPQGAGYAKGGRLIADRAVVDAAPGPGGDGLALTATGLVEVLSGVKPAAARPATTTTPATTRPLARPARATNRAAATPKGVPIGLAAGIAVALVAVLLAVGAVVVARRRRA